MSGATGQAPAAEEVLDPLQPIIDAHHHLYERPGCRYLLDDMLADLRCGHDVRATVLVQARSMLRTDGPEAMKPVGETEFANGVANACAEDGGGRVQVAAAIVGAASLRLGDAVRPVLEAHLAAAGGDAQAGGRFRGIRDVAAWDADTSLLNPGYPTTEPMLVTREFRAGFAHLAALDLSFDAWIFFHQIPRLTALARAFPDTRIVLDHCGGIVGSGRHAGQRDAVFAQWSTALRELATCPQVMVKLGGLGMPLSGFGFDCSRRAATSAQLAEAWRPWFETCIDAFGPSRCMFESNFPADRVSCTYGVGWNAMKRIAAGFSADERADLFWRSAARFYHLPADLFHPHNHGVPL